MKHAYYNEIDPYAAQWLRNLISAGHLPAGDVDERSIVDVEADDVAGYRQCHFFAGIGGWGLAATLAGWPDDRELWTGSCPCQPFSAIGKRAGESDERHLWPEFFRLIVARKPVAVFGEQVASVDGLQWINGVCDDMETAGYAFGATDICAASIGAPHIRQRLYWMGHAEREGLERYGWNGATGGGAQASGSDPETSGGSNRPASLDAVPVLQPVDMHDTRGARFGLRMPGNRQVGHAALRPWEQFDALPCSDGWRRVRSGTFPLAHGIPARMGRLRAYGNAIVPQVAAEVIAAYMEYRP